MKYLLPLDKEEKKMIGKSRSSRILGLTLAVLLASSQIVFIGTAAFTTAKWDTAVKEEIDKEQIKEGIEKEQRYHDEKLSELAKQYDVETEYLQYIVDVEKKFELEPYELMAIIAQESGFKPQTKMDAGSLSYNTTQMKMPTAKTAYLAITEYYKMDIPYPTHEQLRDDKEYAALLAGGYLRYLHDTYGNKYESYTAYRWGIGGRLNYYSKNGTFKSPYAVSVAELSDSFSEDIKGSRESLSE